MEFIPENEDERKFQEDYDGLSKYMSEKIKALPEKDRLHVLRAVGLNDTSLMNLYLQAYKKEDYETCAPAKALLIERGFTIPDL